ncbi:MAG: type II toxin-antitoxin system HicA family toxin [Patescibacteria group bacterium]
MPKFPAFTDKQVIKKIRQCGFIFYKQCKGSHEMWIRNLDNKIIILPRHAGRIIKRKTLKDIIDATGLTIYEFNNL